MHATRTLAIFTTLIMLAACQQTPSVQAPGGSTDTANIANGVQEGMIFDEQFGKQLFTAQVDENGRLDFQLYLKDSNGRITKLPLPEGETRAMGAAFDAVGDAAYVLVRVNEATGMRNAIYRVDLQQQQTQLVYQVNQDEVFALGTNGLRFHDGILEFSGMSAAPNGEAHPEASLFRLPLLQSSVAAQPGLKLETITYDAPAARSYLQFAQTANARDLSAQRVSSTLKPQAVTGYYSWPKAGSGHHSGGSGFHNNDAAYALDINRASGNLDEGDDVLAAQAGSVVDRGTGDTRGTYGNYLVVRHGNGTETLYGHMLTGTFLPAGTTYVSNRAFLGEVGQSGLDHTDPQQTAHLHFHLRQGSTAIKIGTTSHGMNVRVGTGACFTEALTNSDMRFTNQEYTSC